MSFAVLPLRVVRLRPHKTAVQSISPSRGVVFCYFRMIAFSTLCVHVTTSQLTVEVQAKHVYAWYETWCPDHILLVEHTRVKLPIDRLSAQTGRFTWRVMWHSMSRTMATMRGGVHSSTRTRTRLRERVERNTAGWRGSRPRIGKHNELVAFFLRKASTSKPHTHSTIAPYKQYVCTTSVHKSAHCCCSCGAIFRRNARWYLVFEFEWNCVRTYGNLPVCDRGHVSSPHGNALSYRAREISTSEHYR